jgi:hypothetical protein
MDGSGQSALVHPFCTKGWTNGWTKRAATLSKVSFYSEGY